MKNNLMRKPNWLERKKNKLKKFFRFIRIVKNWPSHYWWKITKPQYAVYAMNSGSVIKIRANTHDRIALNEVWIHEVYSSKAVPIRSTDTIVDIGAHIGTFTIKAALQASAGKVYSFELAPDNFNLLLENIELNKLTNVTASNIAISDRKGEVSVHINSDNSLASSLANTSNETSLSTKINTETLDNIVALYKLDRIDFLKIDCEGSEYDILFSASDAALSMTNNICVEADNIDQARNPEIMVKFLNEKNFLTESVRTPYGGIVIYACRKK